MLRSLLCVGCLAAVYLGALSACAEDWPEFRGPTRDGHSRATGLPTEWNEDKNVVWTAKTTGEGWSSPVVVGDRIYFTSAVPVPDGQANDRSLRALCLNAVDGTTVWDVELFEQKHESTDKIHGKNSHASPTPVVRDGRVYVHFGTNGTACLTTDGKIIWKTQELKYKPQHGNGGSPLVTAGHVIVSCDGLDVQFVVALDAETGKIRWKTTRPDPMRAQKFSFSTPQLIEIGGKPQVVSSGTNVVVAYDPVDGNELWKLTYTGYSVIPRPVFGHGMIFLGTGYNTPSLLAIRADGSGDVTESHLAWQTNRAAPHTPSLLIVGDELYSVSDGGIANCYDAKTGDVHWSKRVGGNYSASPLYAEGRIYLQDEKGEGVILKASKEYEEIGRNKLPGRTLASYGVYGKSLLIRTDAALYRIENLP